MAKLINRIMNDELIINFYCRNETSIIKGIKIDSPENDRNDMLEYYVVKKGQIIKHENMTKANPYFLEYLMNDFNLTDHLEKKYPGKY
jgi:hypothetical protein